MQRFLNEHLWFIINAALVAGLVALGSTLSAREAGEPAPSSLQTAKAPAGVQVVLGDLSSTTIERPAPPPAPARTAPPSRPARPRIIGGEEDDD